jgi:hypothetical protein
MLVFARNEGLRLYTYFSDSHSTLLTSISGHVYDWIA